MNETDTTSTITKIGPRSSIYQDWPIMQKITTPAGEILVVLPLDEYQALVGASDIAAHKKAMASLARGETELLTASETMALVEAPTPLKFWRKKRGLTQSILAASAGISQNYLSDLEKGRRKGDPALFKKFATLLKVPIEALVKD